LNRCATAAIIAYLSTILVQCVPSENDGSPQIVIGREDLAGHLSPSPSTGAELSRREPFPACWSERGSRCTEANERASSRQVEARMRCVSFPATLLAPLQFHPQPKGLCEPPRCERSSHSQAPVHTRAHVSPPPARLSRVHMICSGEVADLKTALTSLERGSGTT